MNKSNVKKFFPGLISIIIIAGMAASTFATNVDMAAFVDKDKYMTKYYELDWRIDEIEKKLERMYKFVCTNVRSFAGSAYTHQNLAPNIFGTFSVGTTFPYNNYPIVCLEEQKYLKFNNQALLINYGNYANTRTFVNELPASLCKWRDGIELRPDTKIRITATRQFSGYGADTRVSQGSRVYYEFIIGPFKKFPHITTTGTTSGFICSSDKFTGTNGIGGTTVSYAYNQETLPTSWTSMTGNMALGSLYAKGYNGSVVKQPRLTPEDLANYAFKDPYKSNNWYYELYVATAFSVNLSTYKDVWIKASYTENGSNASNVIFNTYNTITDWNYNK